MKKLPINKPTILIKKDLIDIFTQSLIDLDNIILAINEDQEHNQWYLKAMYVYGYTVFETTLFKTYFRVLRAFPERMKEIGISKLDSEVIADTSLLTPLIERFAYNVSNSFAYGDICEILKKYNRVMQIGLDIKNISCAMKDIIIDRNNLVHRGSLEYPLASNDVTNCINIVKKCLIDVRDKAEAKYHSFTKLHLLKESWLYLFEQWRFELFFIQKEGSYYVDKDFLDKVGGTLCTSERMLMILFLTNYSNSICKDAFTTQDLCPIVLLDSYSQNKLAYITELFIEYPLLMQSDFDE